MPKVGMKPDSGMRRGQARYRTMPGGAGLSVRFAESWAAKHTLGMTVKGGRRSGSTPIPYGATFPVSVRRTTIAAHCHRNPTNLGGRFV
jgi:hypothetical protein